MVFEIDGKLSLGELIASNLESENGKWVMKERSFIVQNDILQKNLLH